MHLSKFLTTLLWSVILSHLPTLLWAQDLPALGTQAVNLDGQPVATETTFTGGFSVDTTTFQSDGTIAAQQPVTIKGTITVDPKQVGQTADLIVYVNYGLLDQPLSPETSTLLMVGMGLNIQPWNADVTSLIPFVKQVQLQATQPVDIYNGSLSESRVQISFGYMLEDGTLITNQLPIAITVEALPEAVNAEAEDEEESEAKIDTTPLLTEEGKDDGRLVGEQACKWKNGQTLKVAFDFNGADFKYTPAVCSSGMARSVCENTVADMVVKTASIWSQYGNIYFRKSSWEDADIRVRFREVGSHSLVGRCKSGTGETMNLAFSFLRSFKEFRGTVLHEFGHAIGLHHEHQSPNEAYNWQEAQIISEMSKPPNNWDAQTIRSNVIDSLLKGSSRSAFFTTKFDPQSIMIYDIPKTWVSRADLADPNRCPDAAATTSIYCVAPNSELSEMDKQGIAGFYSQRSLGNGCSYTYDPSNYRPGTSLWDGTIKFNNPTSSKVKVTLYYPDRPWSPFGSWYISGRTNSQLFYKNKELTLSMNWGIQVNDSPICILKVVSDWKSNYFQVSTTRIPGM